MAKAPGFMWYPKDCDTDENVRAMDDREFGFYMRCLNHSWLNDGLPADLEELARVMQRKKAYVKKLWARVGKCFEVRLGRNVNPKQEDQRASVREYVESRKKGAEARWKHKHEASTSTSITDAHAMHMENMRVGSANRNPVLESKNPIPEAAVNPSLRFSDFWNLYPVKDNRPMAEAVWLSIVDRKDEEKVFACLGRYLQSDRGMRSPKNPCNWLHDSFRDNWESNWPKAAERASRQQEAEDAWSRA